MEMTDFYRENWLNNFDDVDAGLLTTETKFHELDDYTSLVALMIISMIDEEYNVTVTGDDMKKTGNHWRFV